MCNANGDFARKLFAGYLNIFQPVMLIDKNLLLVLIALSVISTWKLRPLTYYLMIPTTGNDPTATIRKKDHIEMAFRSQVAQAQLDTRFFYEPVLAAHPREIAPFQFLGKTFRVPMWVSSMTGGTQMARTINNNLARACAEFGFGMGLGSCRLLLSSNEYFEDFNVRPIMGFDVPLFANLGIAQVEQLLMNNQWHLAEEMVSRLQADGLIIHINPTQEWLQPEGDRLETPPLQLIAEVLSITQIPIIVKEVGQGMGPESLRALFKLPLAAIDFAAAGGTNFALLELLRSDETRKNAYECLSTVGHSAAEMINFTNQIVAELGEQCLCRQVIISGGVNNFLDGYYLIESLHLPAIYGQASAFLRYAKESYELLQQYVSLQAKGYAYAQQYLKVRKN
ncbi:MAG: isopentenyl-diphosphate delta-isomerase [Cytophagales bacterium]|nr:isopentenyl-diphosphate delta-isomerase [Bernardetiaceae bacterium]MDW8203492.1 isopentenyl-diphosphate delta-isomerase [Cytophagales bacterium]